MLEISLQALVIQYIPHSVFTLHTSRLQCAPCMSTKTCKSHLSCLLRHARKKNHVPCLLFIAMVSVPASTPLMRIPIPLRPSGVSLISTSWTSICITITITITAAIPIPIYISISISTSLSVPIPLSLPIPVCTPVPTPFSFPVPVLVSLFVSVSVAIVLSSIGIPPARALLSTSSPDTKDVKERQTFENQLW